MIEFAMNQLGMIGVCCNHVKGYEVGKGKNICSRCRNKVFKILNSLLKNRQLRGYK